MLEKAARTVSTILIGVLVARHLGPEPFGWITLAITISATLYSFATLGIEGILIRKIVELKKGKNSSYVERNYNLSILITSTLFLRLISGAVCYIIANLYIAVVYELDQVRMLISLLVTFSLIFQAGDVIDLYNQGELRGKKTAIVKIISYIVTNILRFFLVKIDASVVLFAFSYFLEFLVIFALLLRQFKISETLQTSIDAVYFFFRDLIFETWPIMVAGCLVAVTTRIDQIFVATILDAKTFGMYSAAILIGAAPQFIPGIICGSLISTATQYKLSDKRLYNNLIIYAYIINISLSILICICGYIFSDDLVEIMFGGEFSISAEYLRLYVFLNVPVFIGVTHSIWMITERRMQYLLIKSIISSTLAVILALGLMPKYEVIGAIYSLLISTFFAELCFPIIYWKFVKFRSKNGVNVEE